MCIDFENHFQIIKGDGHLLVPLVTQQYVLHDYFHKTNRIRIHSQKLQNQNNY